MMLSVEVILAVGQMDLRPELGKYNHPGAREAFYD